MPTYEYRCPNGHEFDRFHKTMSGAPTELACPECQAVASRQLSGGAGLLFKGSGFYLTDYGKNAHRKSEGAKPDAKKADAQKGEGGKTESKADASVKSDSGSAKSESPKPKTDTSRKPKSE